jgi:type 1 glutamine amidotransferase
LKGEINVSKKVFVIWDDINHPEATYTDIIAKIFKTAKWDLETTYFTRDILKLKEMPDLLVCLTTGRPDGETPLSFEEQRDLKKMVEKGMNIMFVHGGLACIEAGSPLMEISLGHFLTHPQPHNIVHCCAIPGIFHPILDGFESFEDPDEHYFCYVDVEHAHPFLCSRSSAGTEIAGWTQQLGKGRVCSITPGHNAPILAKMQKLLENAAAWCVNER